MTKIYYYILKVDDGFAPCVDNGILTLAICKPAIRRTAREDNWIVGLSPKKDGHKLIYAAQVTRRIPGQKYYSQKTFPGRSDRIYDFDGTRFSLKKRRGVHNEANRKSDVGSFPDYENAFVLKSSGKSFWYFGNNARNLPSTQYPALGRKLNLLQQGSRVNHTPTVHREMLAMIKDLRKRKPGVHGKPRDPLSKLSHESRCSKEEGVC